MSKRPPFLTPDEMDTLDHCLSYVLVRTEAAISTTSNADHLFAFKLARAKVKKLRLKLFPGNATP